MCITAFMYVTMVTATAQVDFCEVQYVHKTATNQYDPLGNKFNIRNNRNTVLTVRGRMVVPKKETKDGIEISHTASGSLPFLRIFIKDTNTRLQMKKGKVYQLETIVAILDSRPNYPTYKKSTWNDAVYSLSNGLIYQVIPDFDGFHIRINDQYRYFRYPDKYIKKSIRHVSQIGRASVFKEVSLCPDTISALIAQENSQLERKPALRGYSQAFPRTYIKLICTVAGYPNLNVSWWYEGQAIFPGNPDYLITMSSTTSITTQTSELSFLVSLEREGWYTCRVQNEYNQNLTNSSYHQVEATIPLMTHISEPKFQIVSQGANVVFTCKITQWRSGGESVSWEAIDSNFAGALETSVTLLSKTEKQAVLWFRNVTVHDTGVFQCGSEIATLYVEVPSHYVTVEVEKASDTVLISCSGNGVPTPSLDVKVFYDEYRNSDQIMIQETHVDKTRNYVKKQYTLDQRKTYIRIRYVCEATQEFSNGTFCRSSSAGYHVMPFPGARDQHRNCNFTMVTGNGSIMRWMGSYTPHRYVSNGKITSVDCNSKVSNDGDVVNVTTVPNETMLLAGSKFTIRCQVHVHPCAKHLLLLKDNTPISTLSVGDNDVRPYLDYVVESVNVDADGFYDCVLSDRNISANHVPESKIKTRVSIYREATVEINSTDILKVLGNNRFMVLNGSHVHFTCRATGFPVPHSGVVTVNLQPIESQSFSDKTFIETTAFIPINQTLHVACHVFQKKFGKDIVLKKEMIFTPIKRSQNYFLSKFSGIEILAISGFISFSVLLAITCCWVGCAYAINNYTSSEFKSYELSKVKNVLNQLIEQPFVDRYSYFRNSYFCSSEGSHDAKYLYQREEVLTTAGSSVPCRLQNVYDEVATEFDETTDDNVDEESESRTQGLKTMVNVHRNMAVNRYSSYGSKRRGMVVLSNNRHSNQTYPSNLSNLTNPSTISNFTLPSNVSTEDSDQINKVLI